MLVECKRAGFVRYSRLNVYKLRQLLSRGSHEISPKRKRWHLKVHSGRGRKIDQYDCNEDRIDCYLRWDARNGRFMDGYTIRGIDLEGRFDSVFIPDTEEEKGGWYVRSCRYGEFKEMRRILNEKQPPRSLQQLAANVVLSRKMTAVPLALKRLALQFKDEIVKS